MSKPKKPHNQKQKPAPKPTTPEPASLAGDPYYQARAQALHERVTLTATAPPRDSEQDETGETQVSALKRWWERFLTWRRGASK
jgi:hypothetical protein